METNTMITFNTIADFIADTKDYNSFRIVSNKQRNETPNYMECTELISEYGTLTVSRTLTYPETYPTVFISAQKTAINDKIVYLVAFDKGELLTIEAHKKEINENTCTIIDFNWNTFIHERYFDTGRSHFHNMSGSNYIVVDMDKLGKLNYIQQQKIVKLLETTTKLYIRDMAKTVYFKVDKNGNVEVGVYDLDQERFLKGKEIEIEDIDLDCLSLATLDIKNTKY